MIDSYGIIHTMDMQKITNLLNMSVLPQSNIPTEVVGPLLTVISWWEDPRVKRLVDDIMAWLEESANQTPRLYDVNWFPITLGIPSESSDYERRLAAGMFSKRYEDPESMALVFANIHETQRLVDGMFR